MKALTKNACRCRKCQTVIESTDVHHFVRCPCGAIFTDGGLEYIRRGGQLDQIEDLSEYGPDDGGSEDESMELLFKRDDEDYTPEEIATLAASRMWPKKQ